MTPSFSLSVIQRSKPCAVCFQIMSCVEVGLAPGSYRIIDLFCFKEVLNQIMKVAEPLPVAIISPYPQCSCQSSNGFGLFQQDLDESGSSSFHSILDIVCCNCKQKVPNLIKFI